MRGKKWIVVAALTVLLAPAALFAGPRVRIGVSVGAPAQRARVVYVPHRHAPRTTYVVRAGRPAARVVHVNYGSVDFNIEPQHSLVFVDGAYLGVADDFNGYPQTAKLPAGYHQVKVVAPDGTIVERRIYVAAGQELNFNLEF